jgi:hypothetical protein
MISTATLHAIVHPEAIFCTSPITGDQYDRVRVLESLGYHVIIKGSPIIGPSGEMVNISDPYVAENVNNDVGERDLITIYASEIQNETALGKYLGNIGCDIKQPIIHKRLVLSKS